MIYGIRQTARQDVSKQSARFPLHCVELSVSKPCLFRTMNEKEAGIALVVHVDYRFAMCVEKESKHSTARLNDYCPEKRLETSV